MKNAALSLLASVAVAASLATVGCGGGTVDVGIKGPKGMDLQVGVGTAPPPVVTTPVVMLFSSDAMVSARCWRRSSVSALSSRNTWRDQGDRNESRSISITASRSGSPR